MLLDNTVNIYVIHRHYVWFHIYESQYKTKFICNGKIGTMVWWCLVWRRHKGSSWDNGKGFWLAYCLHRYIHQSQLTEVSLSIYFIVCKFYLIWKHKWMVGNIFIFIFLTIYHLFIIIIILLYSIVLVLPLYLDLNIW